MFIHHVSSVLKLVLSIILFSMINKDLCAQNLVPNPGFENLYYLPGRVFRI